MIELKAKCENFDNIRRILNDIGAKYIGVFLQKDIYYVVGEERLKLRNIDDKEYKLIYYIRTNVPNIKESKVLISRVVDAETLNEILDKVLGTKVIVEKIREIYHFKNVKVHLDVVNSLGKFIEFEVESDEDRRERDFKVIKQLMGKFKIDESELIDGSYSDLIINKKGCQSIK